MLRGWVRIQWKYGLLLGFSVCRVCLSLRCVRLSLFLSSFLFFLSVALSLLSLFSPFSPFLPFLARCESALCFLLAKKATKLMFGIPPPSLPTVLPQKKRCQSRQRASHCATKLLSVAWSASPAVPSQTSGAAQAGHAPTRDRAARFAPAVIKRVSKGSNG